MPTLYLFVGYPGAGKTTIARLIAARTGAINLWADLERHTMFKQPTHSPAESRELYSHLNSVAEDLLSNGQSVIFDTNFNYRKDRQLMRDIAAKHGADVKLVWITTGRDLARKRATEESEHQETRVWGNMAASEFDRMSGNLEPPTDDEQPIRIDGTAIDPDHVASQLGIL